MTLLRTKYVGVTELPNTCGIFVTLHVSSMLGSASKMELQNIKINVKIHARTAFSIFLTWNNIK